MSSFECKVRRITVETHPNADLLEIGRVDGYQFVVGKGQFKTGDLGVYIPEQSVLPDPLIKEMGLEGKLAGSSANRVKAIKLRGVLSQGLFYRPEGLVFSEDVEGKDVAADLGITKWEPPVPLEMAGQVEAAPGETIFRSYTDIEDIKRYPDVLVEGEEVLITEKLHGSCTIVGILNGQRVVSSKGLASKHLVLVESQSNIYWRIAHQERLFERLEKFMRDYRLSQVLLFGEVLGVQDLMYGLTKGQLTYRAFDLCLQDGQFSAIALNKLNFWHDVPLVPQLYRGPFSKEVLAEHTSGKSTLADHIREGVVVRRVEEREHPELGRVILKSISPDYLLRKGGTELN
jgi:RNA ligase (TIGR02306 family)